jgi:transposase
MFWRTLARCRVRLSDAEWARLEPLLSRRRKWTHRVDDQRVVIGILP